jgi:hypothetical protein
MLAAFAHAVLITARDRPLCFKKNGVPAGSAIHATYVVSGEGEDNIMVSLYQAGRLVTVSPSHREGQLSHTVEGFADFALCVQSTDHFKKKVDIHFAFDEKSSSERKKGANYATDEHVTETIIDVQKILTHLLQVLRNQQTQSERLMLHEGLLGAMSRCIVQTGVIKICIVVAIFITQLYVISSMFNKKKHVQV